MIPQSEIDSVEVFNTYLDAASVADFERKMRNYNAKYKCFKGIYRRELDGQMILMVNTPYGWQNGAVSEETHIYEYYKTAGDYLLYLYDKPTSLDVGTATKGSIVYFDGTLLRAETNPFWKEGNVKTSEHYDVCIVGGGSAGFAAAYALRDSGYKVCLVEMLDSLGGTNLNGGIIRQIASPIGNWYKELCKAEYTTRGFTFNTSTYSIGSENETETDFDKLWRGSMLNYSTSDLGNLCTMNPFTYRKVYEDAISETVNILYNRRVVDSKTVDGKIIYAVFENTLNGGKETISAEYFIDCTANLDLLRCNKTVGEDYYIGSDGADLYGESAYKSGAVANKYEINTLEQAYYVVVGTEQYPQPGCNGRIDRYTADLNSFPDDDAVSANVNGTYSIPWTTEDFQNCATDVRGTLSFGSTVSPGKYAYIPTNAYVDGGYDYARAIGFRKAMASAKKLNKTKYCGVLPMLAIRESYRMKCDYMLTQADVESKITSTDLVDKHIIALSSWYCDIHNPLSLSTSNVAPSFLNGIPYEALIPSCYTNALVACRGLGASHVAASAFRLTRTMLSVGYAAGKAIEQARDGWLNDVRDIDIATLQTDVEIVDLLNDIETNILAAEENVE